MKKMTSAVFATVLLGVAALAVVGCSSGAGVNPGHVVYSVEGRNGNDGAVVEGGAQWPEELPAIDGCQGTTVMRSGEIIQGACSLPGSYADAKAKVQAAIAGAVTSVSMETDTGDWYQCAGNLDERTTLSGMVTSGSDDGNAIVIQRTPADAASES